MPPTTNRISGTQQCGRVEPWIYGWSWVKFTDMSEPVKMPHKGYRRCPEPAVVFVVQDGLTFFWCAEHAENPTQGAPAVLQGNRRPLV